MLNPRNIWCYNEKIRYVLNNLQFVSDLHLEKGFTREIKISKPFLLLGGDIGNVDSFTYKSFLFQASYNFEKVFVLKGNHEYNNFEHKNYVDIWLRDLCSKRNNLFYLQNDTYTLCPERNIDIAGCTLWSPLPCSKNFYHKEDTKWLENTLKCKNKFYVVATHHAPLLECLNKFDNSDYFASNQTKMFENNNLLCWIYGHTHINKNFNHKGRWLFTNQYGSYPDPLYGYNS